MGRPASRFQNFVGQRRVVRFLQRQLTGAQARQEPFPHALLSGASGLGKTYLARALADEYGTNLHEATGRYSAAELIDKLAALKPADFLLIDECHRLGHREQELLFQAIDERGVHYLVDDPRQNKRVRTRMALPSWTLVLATDQPGRLLNAMRRRIVIHEILQPYPLRELKEIVAGMAADQNLLLSPQATRLVAQMAQGVPRKATFLLRLLRLHFANAESAPLGLREVRQLLKDRGIDRHGLDSLQRRYLFELRRRETASAESMAAAMGTDRGFAQREIEDPLVRSGFIQISSAGRRLTEAGAQLLDRAAATGSTNKVTEEEHHAID
jgi:Holliday junction DNA helicase RuvB